MAKAKKSAKKPKIEKPVWLNITEEELKKIIAELAEKYSASQIGMILRDQYGVPTAKVFGKKLNSYLKELKINKNEELEKLETKAGKIQAHFKKNPTDRKAKHKLQKAQSRYNLLKRYFEKKK